MALENSERTVQVRCVSCVTLPGVLACSSAKHHLLPQKASSLRVGTEGMWECCHQPWQWVTCDSLALNATQHLDANWRQQQSAVHALPAGAAHQLQRLPHSPLGQRGRTDVLAKLLKVRVRTGHTRLVQLTDWDGGGGGTLTCSQGIVAMTREGQVLNC